MKHQIKNLRKENGTWKCTVISWSDCYCGRTEQDVEIDSDRMPKKGDIIAAITPVL